MSIDRKILRLCYDQMKTRQKIAVYYHKSNLPSQVFFCIIQGANVKLAATWKADCNGQNPFYQQQAGFDVSVTT